ncbi:hypothetical protein Tco_1244041 [Tanacetum coccineum]
MHEDFEYVKSLEKEIDELESEKADFSNMYDLLLEEVNHTTSVSRPQLKCYQVKDKVLPNNSQVKFKKKEVEDHHRISSISKKIKSVKTTCNEQFRLRTSNVNAVCADVEMSIVQLILFIVDSGCTKHMTGNLKLLCNFVEKFLGTVRFGNDQFAPILGYGDLIQGNVTIKRVYYVEGLNHNLFSVGQFCDADLEVAFRKSTCFVRDLQGNDLLTGSQWSDLYHNISSRKQLLTPICFMAMIHQLKHGYGIKLSHLNFDYIHLSKEEGIDFEESFVSCSLGSSSDFVAHAATQVFPSIRSDVKTAYLNGPLKEVVFVAPSQKGSLNQIIQKKSTF